MSTTVTIRDSDLTVKDPADERVYTFDWDADELQEGATIVSSDFEVVPVSGDTDSDPLTADEQNVLAGDRKTQVRLSAGALGSTWRINNRIVTNETPAQTIERSFFVLVQDR